MADAHGLLLRSLCRLAGDEVRTDMIAASCEPWASVTFTGARHAIALRLTGGEAPRRAARIAKGIGEVEFALRGHLVADIVATASSGEAGTAMLAIEALTVEAA